MSDDYVHNILCNAINNTHESDVMGWIIDYGLDLFWHLLRHDACLFIFIQSNQSSSDVNAYLLSSDCSLLLHPWFIYAKKLISSDGNTRVRVRSSAGLTASSGSSLEVVQGAHRRARGGPSWLPQGPFKPWSGAALFTSLIWGECGCVYMNYLEIFEQEASILHDKEE